MTAILHQLRTRSRALTHGLLLVLLATWLAAVCPHCLAEAAEVPEAAAATGHCHSEAPPPAEAPVAGHDCCPQSPVCSGAGCVQMTSLAAAEPAAFVFAEPGAQVPPMPAATSQAYPAAPPPPPPLAQRIATDACPLYLRHCSLLN